MISKTEFVNYCYQVRKIHGSLSGHQDIEWCRDWIEAQLNRMNLYELFELVGLWGGSYGYQTDFAYSELAELTFTDLSDQSTSNYSVDEILEKLCG